MTKKELNDLFYKAHRNFYNPRKAIQMAVDLVYNDFEPKLCESCKHYTNTYYNTGGCAKNVFILLEDDNEGVTNDFGCTLHES